MNFVQSKIPEQVTQAYWDQVTRLLKNRHRLNTALARECVRIYRETLLVIGVYDAIYHAPVDETADGIVTGGYVVKARKELKQLKRTAKLSPNPGEYSSARAIHGLRTKFSRRTSTSPGSDVINIQLSPQENRVGLPKNVSRRRKLAARILRTRTDRAAKQQIPQVGNTT